MSVQQIKFGTDGWRGVVADDVSTAYVMESTGGRVAEWNWQTGQKVASYRPSCGGTRGRRTWG